MIQSYETDVFMDSIGMRVWEKRHQYVASKLAELQCKKVLDMGTNCGKLIQRLSRSTELYQIVIYNEIPQSYFDSIFNIQDGVDIDLDVLNTQAVQNAKPDLIQNQYASLRNQQLVVSLYQGNALQKIQSLKDQNYDAITLVEIIEHLRVEDVHLLEENLFGFLRPNYVIVTTPNSDFNVYFNFMESGIQFRDEDHKFEWSQKEFVDWASNVSQKYGYKIQELTGVGEHKSEGTKNGYCSQIVVFEKQIYYEQYLNLPSLTMNLKEGEVNFICKYLYPFETKEAYFKREIVQCIRYCLFNSEDYYTTEDGFYQNSITLQRLMTNNEIANCFMIQRDFYRLKHYIQQFNEFLVHDDPQIENSVITTNYLASMDSEDIEIQEEDEGQIDANCSNQNYISCINDGSYCQTETINNNLWSTQESNSTFSTPKNAKLKQVFIDQQMNLECNNFEEEIDY